MSASSDPTVPTLTFVDAHRPALDAGEYTVTATLEVVPPPEAPAPAPPPGTLPPAPPVPPPPVVTRLFVAGERFHISKGAAPGSPGASAGAAARPDIYALHPAPGSQGAFHGRVAHVVFNRSTLPWERNPGKGDAKSAPPWLAILLFRQTEAPAVATVKFSDLAAPPSGVANLWSGSLSDRPGQDPDEAITVIDVDRVLLQTLLPTWGELPYTAHARILGGAGPDVERAVLLGTRVIEPVTRAVAGDEVDNYVAHLVSVEAVFDEHGSATALAGSAAKVRVITLHHWQFADHEGDDFGATVQACHGVETLAPFRLHTVQTPSALPTPVTLPAGGDESEAANLLLAAGSVPLPYRMRGGDQTVAWYRGPLVAGLGSDGRLAAVPLPTRAADDLTLFDPRTGMFDVSYAVAWELGRLTALSDQAFALALTRWKRARAQGAARLRMEADSAFLPYAAAVPELADFPPEAASFLEHLASLVAVPPAHLVPDPRLLPSLPGTPGVLPTGAFRFVDVDPMWVESLVDGALSLGRVTEGDHVRDAQHNRTLPSRLGVSGILLRSRVVADYPDLAVDGYRLSSGSPPQNGANATAAAVAANAAAWTALDPVCLRRLAPDLLLALFYAPDGLDRVDLHLPPHGMHFGLTVEDQKGAATYLVQPRDVGTGKECGGPWPVAGCFRTDGTTVSDTPSATRVLALDKLAAVTVPAAAPRSSHTLAIQLLAQPLRVMIWRGAAETSS